jgi:hypothetical protein
MPRVEVFPTLPTAPLEIILEEAPSRVTTTLYDVIADLQTAVGPEEDALVVAIVADWLRSGRLSFPADVTSAT